MFKPSSVAQSKLESLQVEKGILDNELEIAKKDKIELLKEVSNVKYRLDEEQEKNNDKKRKLEEEVKNQREKETRLDEKRTRIDKLKKKLEKRRVN